jgi:acyl-CoA synthetase (AMP-forming)/AMP-acid ligase II
MQDRFLSDIERFDSSIALTTESGYSMSYSDLAQRADAFAQRIGPSPRLLLLECANEVEAIVAYVGALRGGHPVILVGPESDIGRVRDSFHPNYLFRSDGLAWRLDGLSPEALGLHPDLAVLLSTSGSTGSPKLVRLSHQNIGSNARSIAQYLGIRADDRAITSLPFHYSFGMSVINSHLECGATIILTERSVAGADFWELFESQSATSIAGVPHSYEIFERRGLRNAPPPTLRTMIQAGGRLAPALVKAYAEFGRKNDVAFFTMYGQTEASPRMAYLPPEMAAANPDCIGLPVPGGSFRLLSADETEITTAGESGELVYSGPNVMMGYANSPADLALGAQLTELRTGDIAQRTKSGLFRIVGRANRFSKLAGLRISLDDVEAQLEASGFNVAVAGDDRRIVVCVMKGGAAAARDRVGVITHLPASMIVAYDADEAPRLPTGKVNFREVMAIGEKIASQSAAAIDGKIAAVYATALGLASVPDDASFATLGGDSLSYVDASIGIEKALGQLPPEWPTMTVAELSSLIPAQTQPASRLVNVDTEIVLRITALIMVIIGHGSPDNTEWLRGGSLILFTMAGYNFMRFQKPLLLKGDYAAVVKASLSRMVAPYYLMMIVLLMTSKADLGVGWFFLVSTFTIDFRGPLFPFWFIEAVFHSLLISCGLFLIPAFRRQIDKNPFEVALFCVAVSTAAKYLIAMYWTDGKANALTVDAWIYLYFLGWGLFAAKSRLQISIIILLTLGLTLLDWGPASSRPWWITLAAAAVVLTPRILVPRVVSTAISRLAADSYFIYLAHVLALQIVLHVLGVSQPVAAVASGVGLAIVLGLAYARGWRLGMLRLGDTVHHVRARFGRPSSGAGEDRLSKSSLDL